jgi:hypothetical protein
MRAKKSVLIFAGLLGLFPLASCTEEEPENFGDVRIEVAPVGGDTAIVNGTVEVQVTVDYQTCLQDFYLLNHTTYTQDGIDGAAVFEEWAGRLCQGDDIPDCEVTEIKQTLVEANGVYSLKVTFKINDPATIPYREFHVGPLPLEAFASCGDSQSPLVELPQAGLTGRDANGTQLWRISSFQGPNVAEANQGAPLRVEIVATTMP